MSDVIDRTLKVDFECVFDDENDCHNDFDYMSAESHLFENALNVTQVIDWHGNRCDSRSNATDIAKSKVPTGNVLDFSVDGTLVYVFSGSKLLLLCWG